MPPNDSEVRGWYVTFSCAGEVHWALFEGTNEGVAIFALQNRPNGRECEIAWLPWEDYISALVAATHIGST